MAIIWACPYCDSEYPEKRQLVDHLIAKHRLKMQKVLESSRDPSMTIKWAAGMTAAYCAHVEGKDREGG